MKGDRQEAWEEMISRAARQGGGRPAPPTLIPRVLSAIEAQPAVRRSPFARWSVLAASLAAALAVGAFFPGAWESAVEALAGAAGPYLERASRVGEALSPLARAAELVGREVLRPWLIIIGTGAALLYAAGIALGNLLYRLAWIQR